MSTPSFTPAQVLECARAIRAFLPDLLPADRAQQIDAQLANLLAQAKTGPIVIADFLQVFMSQPTVQTWAGEFLSPQIISKGPGDTQLPGRMGFVSAPRYVCPEGDYVFYRRSVGTPLRPCPTHPDLTLVLED